jgi:hypothetical protein
VADLRRICEERQRVIEGLGQAARERLVLVEQLNAECARLRALRPD